MPNVRSQCPGTVAVRLDGHEEALSTTGSQTSDDVRVTVKYRRRHADRFRLEPPADKRTHGIVHSTIEFSFFATRSHRSQPQTRANSKG